MKLFVKVTEFMDMFKSLLFTSTESSLVMTQELELIAIVQRYIPGVVNAPVATQSVLEPFR